jgi:hypothetical protein
VASTTDAGEARAGKAADACARDLFGNPLPKEPVKKTAKPSPPPGSSATAQQPIAHEDAETKPKLRGFTTEDVESFKQLNVEVCIETEALGSIWLVPRYSRSDRKEITPEHAATISRVLEAFPGAKVTRFEKRPPEDSP